MPAARSCTYRTVALEQIVAGEVRMDIRLVKGLDEGPRTRGVDTTIPALAGRIRRNRVADGRMIELEGFVSGVGANHAARLADMRTIKNALRTILDPTLDPGELEVLLEDGSVATIQATAMPEEPEWGPDGIETYQTLSIELEAVDDDWVITP